MSTFDPVGADLTQRAADGEYAVSDWQLKAHARAARAALRMPGGEVVHARVREQLDAVTREMERRGSDSQTGLGPGQRADVDARAGVADGGGA